VIDPEASGAEATAKSAAGPLMQNLLFFVPTPPPR
jgi:hypothetical protein